MTKIYLIRHAEAEGNLFRRAQGHWNGKITERGKKQIDALAERFRGVQIDAVYSSDLDRTVETAGAILRYHDLPLYETERLREVCMGVWEGESWGNLTEQYPQQMAYFNSDPAKWSVPGSESFEAAQARMTAVISEIARANDGRTVAVVSHGMAIKIYLMGVMGVRSGDPETMMHGDNTSVSLLEVENGRVKVDYCNDNSHLGDELSTFARQKWWRTPDSKDLTSLRFAPLDPKRRQDAEFYLDCYCDSWVVAHGSSDGFVPNIYLSTARSHSAKDPGSLMKVMSGDDPVGILELDPKRGREDGRGWISLLYLRPEYRGVGLGVQLIGCACAYFSHKGRRSVCLHAAVTNERAVGFYHHFGFRTVRTEPGVASDQYLLERDI